MSMSDYPVMFTVPQVCRMLQMSRSKVYELVTSGEIPSVQIGRSCRVPSDQLEKYVESM